MVFNQSWVLSGDPEWDTGGRNDPNQQGNSMWEGWKVWSWGQERIGNGVSALAGNLNAVIRSWVYQKEWAEELGRGEDSGGEGKGIEQLRSYDAHESNTWILESPSPTTEKGLAREEQQGAEH